MNNQTRFAILLMFCLAVALGIYIRQHSYRPGEVRTHYIQTDERGTRISNAATMLLYAEYNQDSRDPSRIGLPPINLAEASNELAAAIDNAYTDLENGTRLIMVESYTTRLVLIYRPHGPGPRFTFIHEDRRKTP